MSDAPQTFDAAPLDSFAERITSAIALTGGLLMLPVLFWYLSGIGRIVGFVYGIAVSTGIALALAAWLLLSYAAAPTLYAVEQDRLVVRRRWLRALRVPFRQIAAVSQAGALPDLPRRGVRRALNIGVFGYHGLFELAPYGRVFFAATNRERLAAVARTDAPPLLVSPARPKAFVDALREAISQLPEPAAETA